MAAQAEISAENIGEVSMPDPTLPPHQERAPALEPSYIARQKLVYLARLSASGRRRELDGVSNARNKNQGASDHRFAQSLCLPLTEASAEKHKGQRVID